MYYNNQNSLQSTSIPNLLEGKERFFRPSKDPVLFNPFTFQKIKNENISSFSSSEEIIYGFFGILEEAANLDNNPNIGCGTVGNVKEPYPYAYELLSSTKKKSLSYHEFIHLFLGICHISFLKIFQAYVPPDTPPNVNYYMYEIEVITGFPITTSDIKPPGLGLFGYYYGVIKVVYEKKQVGKLMTPFPILKITSVHHIMVGPMMLCM